MRGGEEKKEARSRTKALALSKVGCAVGAASADAVLQAQRVALEGSDTDGRVDGLDIRVLAVPPAPGCRRPRRRWYAHGCG